MRSDCNASTVSAPPLRSLRLCGENGFIYHRDAEIAELTQSKTEDLPMLNEKKTSEVIETSLIYLLSAAVAAGAFVLVGLVALLFGFSQT
jgi:hypothetical protein